eukprot:GHVT01087573.1.p2 GENE.GHVT01087573.1~~GHVT01087573.1.p2  ORF type:complete len:121 (-),score=25.45 GHVT01087573.1:378-740(-)
MEEQPSEFPFAYFSASNAHRRQRTQPSDFPAGDAVSCYKTYTNSKTSSLVEKYMDQLPKYEPDGGRGTAPRYCPSIATKVARFSDRLRHAVWIEPEGLNDPLVYPNGLAGAFPPDIQVLS